MSLQRLTVVVGTYLAPIEAVDAHRDEHLAFMGRLRDEGRVLVAGRREPAEGSVIVLRDVPPAEAHALLEGDPYATAGLVRYEVLATFGPGVRAPGLDELLGAQRAAAGEVGSLMPPRARRTSA